MNRVVKTTIASALVLSMALSGTTAAMAAAPVEEENCISAASIANWAENTRIKLFNKSVYAKYNPGVTVEKDENSPTGYTVTFIYKERKSYTSNAGLTIDTTENPLTKVELYSDCFMLFDPASGTAGSIDASLDNNCYFHIVSILFGLIREAKVHFLTEFIRYFAYKITNICPHSFKFLIL